jgi:hypothetical protein
LPLIPDAILSLIIEQALQKLADSVSPATLTKIELMLAAAATESPYDDMSVRERNELADLVAKELNESIDIPLVVTQQQEVVLQKVFRTVFSTLSTNKELAKNILVQELDVALNVFKDPASRKLLVDAINRAIDIPILNEDQEAFLFDKLIDQCAHVLDWILPPNFLTTLRSMPMNGMDEMKEYLVNTVSEHVDLPILNDSQERSLIEGLVTVLIDSTNNSTENDATFMMLTEERQREQLLQRCHELEQDMVRCRREYKQEYSNLRAQLTKVRARLARGKRNFRTTMQSSSSRWGRARTNLGKLVQRRDRRSGDANEDDASSFL